MNALRLLRKSCTRSLPRSLSPPFRTSIFPRYYASGSISTASSNPRINLPAISQNKILNVLRAPSIVSFTWSRSNEIRNTYYNSSRGSNRGFSGGFFQNFRRRLDRFPENWVFFGIIGLNGAVFTLWWYANESYMKFRDAKLLIWMNDNFTTSTRNLTQGRFWTLLTSCFSHQDVGHITMNILTFWFMGRPVLGMLGNTSFLALYLSGGLISSFISSGYSALVGRRTGSHGASGAISAVIAFFATMYPTTTFYLFMVVPLPAWLCVGGLAAYDLYGSIKNPNRRVDGAGHLGGFLGGFLYAMRMRGRLF